MRILGPGEKSDRTRGQLIIAALEDRPDFQSEAGQDWALEAIDSAIEEWEYHYASGEGWELVSGGTDCARADVPSSLDVLDFTARLREACANCNVYTAIEENAASFGAMADRLLHPPKPLSQWMPSARRKAAGAAATQAARDPAAAAARCTKSTKSNSLRDMLIALDAPVGSCLFSHDRIFELICPAIDVDFLVVPCVPSEFWEIAEDALDDET